MKFIIDNALSPRISEALVANGYDSVHVRELGLQSATDEYIFSTFRLENHVIISADTDFSTLLSMTKSQMPSIILFRRSIERSPNKQVQTLLSLLPEVADDLAAGCVIVIENYRIRLRKLPLLS